MITRDVCQRILHKAVSTGADYAEIFAENTVNHAINMIANKVDSINDTVIAGAAVRVYRACAPSWPPPWTLPKVACWPVPRRQRKLWARALLRSTSF